jgi:hypothetical protein
MGNGTSKTNEEEGNKLKPRPMSQILDYIATHYILTMDFKSLRKLYNKEYCDKLVILTSDIIERYYTDIEITYLSQRTKEGAPINEKEKVIFFNKDLLNKIDIKNSNKKKNVCMGIAKFYIKIAHIFAAILTTINPIYVYKDTEGNTVRASLYEKSKIPKDTKVDIYKLNICSNRINSLENNRSLEPDANEDITINPDFCNSNIGDDGKEKDLLDEPGIPELEDLYYDDNYDFDTGKFTGMSEKTKEMYIYDLEIFYKVFTGEKVMPQTITKFSDIQLQNYHKKENCRGVNPKLKREMKGPLTDKLFNDYAENLKKMIQTTNKNQEELLKIINRLFVYVIDPETKKKQIRINPSLTEDSLQEIVIEARSLIINLYLTCEVNYVNGLNIYEAIVDQKILDTLQKQTNYLEKKREEKYFNDEVPESAEIKEIKEKMINIEEDTGKPEENTGKPIEITGKPIEITGKPIEITGKIEENTINTGKPPEKTIIIETLETNKIIEKQSTNEPINKEQGPMPAAAMAAGKKR